MKTFSFSRLKLYQTCPKRFYYKYILEREEPVTKPLALGKAVHKAIEEMINGDSLENAIQKGWIDADFHPEVTGTEIKQLVKKAPIHKEMGKTEQYFRFPLDDSPYSPYIQGYIDLVQESEFGVTVSDWKTNWKTYDIRDNHQVALYALAIQHLKGVNEVKGRLAFLRYGKESNHIFDRDDTEQARQWALQLANKINSKLSILDIMPEKADELFPVAPSSACSHCPFVLECFRNFSQYSLQNNGGFKNEKNV
ncbi:PD-(D/E)XK nuclease family protein [Lentibacillus salinarum]|uniref:PD-(D/E)XK nuclease family protein n=1 Tax=Lentibacillus salinarum TaxID=446820 RepID=A0ABW3ZWI8_9BACI